MANKVLSIEIGSQTTRVCEVDFKKKNPHVYHCITFDTPEGTIEDGFIRNANSLAVILREKIATHSIDNRSVVFTIASSKIANREVIIPFVSESKIPGIVAANASDYFPVNIDDYIITHKVLETNKTKEAKNIRLLVLAAPNNLISTYYELANLMDFAVEAIDYIGNSSFQLIKRQVNTGTNLVVQINEQTTLINILQDETLMLQRTVPYGTEIAIKALLESGEFNARTFKEAQELMIREHMINVRFGYASEEVAASNNDLSESYNKQIRAMRAKEDITETFRYLVNNIIRVLDYYTSKNPNSRLDTIYIVGPGSKFRGINHLFSNEISVERVKRFDRLYAVNFNKNVDVTGLDESEYLSCIGSTVEPVDFIPKEHYETVQKKSNMLNYTVILAASVIASVILVASSMFVYMSTNAQKNSIEAEIQSLSGINELYDQYNATKSDLDSIKAMYAMTTSNNDGIVDLFLELEAKMPKNVSFMNFESSSTGISITMEVPTKEEAAKVLQQLKTFETLTIVDTRAVQKQGDEEGSATAEQFTVTADYKTLVTDTEQPADTTVENTEPAEAE